MGYVFEVADLKWQFRCQKKRLGQRQDVAMSLSHLRMSMIETGNLPEELPMGNWE
jgi:hypothetical protein